MGIFEGWMGIQMISFCYDLFVQIILYLFVTKKLVKIVLRSFFQNFKCNENRCATSEYFSPVECIEITKSSIGDSYV